MATELKRMRQLYATDAQWTATNPTLLEGEVAMSSDVRRLKVGPGAWASLPYWTVNAADYDALVASYTAHANNKNNPHETSWANLAGNQPPPIAHTHVEADITNLDRMRWMGSWNGATEYQVNDVVTQTSYLAIANTTTTEPPAPVKVGPPTDLYTGTSPVTETTAKTVLFANDYTLPFALEIDDLRVYTLTGNKYSLFIENLLTGEMFELADFTAETDGWRSYPTGQGVFPVGSRFRVGIYVTEPDPAPVTFTLSYDYLTPNNEAVPAVGAILHASRLPESLRINKTDQNGNQTAWLANLAPGDLINGAGVSWAVIAITDNGTWLDVTVAPGLQGGITGVQDFIFETVTTKPISAMIDPGYYAATSNIQPHISIDGGPDTLTDDGYGVDLTIQQVTISGDWDLMAISGSTAGGGGGGGVSDDYVLREGDTMEGPLIMAAKPLEDLEAATKNYVGVSQHDDTVAYLKDDLVSNQDGVIYFALDDHPPQPFSLANWRPITSVVGRAVNLSYRWTSVTSGQVPAGGYGIDTGDAATATKVRMSTETRTGIPVPGFLSAIAAGDALGFEEETGGAEFSYYLTTGPGTLIAGTPDYFEFPVTLLAFDGLPEDNRDGIVSLVYNPASRLPTGGTARQSLLKVSADDYDTAWFDLVETDITDLDKYTKLEVDTKDQSVLVEVADTYLPLAGGTVTGLLTQTNETSVIRNSGIVYLSIQNDDLAPRQQFVFDPGDNDILVRIADGIDGTLQTRYTFERDGDLADTSSVVTRATGDVRYLQQSGADARYLQLTGGEVTGRVNFYDPITAIRADETRSIRFQGAGGTGTDTTRLVADTDGSFTVSHYVAGSFSTGYRFEPDGSLAATNSVVRRGEGDGRYLQPADAAATYLPLAGGTLTGELIQTALNSIIKRDGTKNLSFREANDTETAKIDADATGLVRVLTRPGGTTVGTYRFEATADLQHNNSVVTRSLGDARYLQQGGPTSISIAGITAAAGGVVAGSGFTCARTGTGQYTITWDTARAENSYVAVMTALRAGASGDIAMINTKTKAAMTIFVQNRNGNNQDADVNFMIIG